MSDSGNAHQLLLPARGSGAVTRDVFWAQICLDALLADLSPKAIIFCCNKMEYRNEKILLCSFFFMLKKNGDKKSFVSFFSVKFRFKVF